MKSGTEKNPNPHEPKLSKFLRAFERPIRAEQGYTQLRNGQIIRLYTWDRIQSAQQQRTGEN